MQYHMSRSPPPSSRSASSNSHNNLLSFIDATAFAMFATVVYLSKQKVGQKLKGTAGNLELKSGRL